MAKHIPVLLNECIEGLNIQSDGIYVDGTVGLGQIGCCQNVVHINTSSVVDSIIAHQP